LTKNLKGIDYKTIPASTKLQLDALTEHKEINNKLTTKITELNKSLDEVKIHRMNDANIFKKKALNFGKQAQEEIQKFKAKYHLKNEKQLEDIQKYKAADVLEVILEPINNIKTAIKVGKKQDSAELKNYLIGFEMLVAQLESKLYDEGVILINPNIGDNFDPKIHTALSTISDQKNKNKIVELKKYGYMLHDRVLIPATVIIGK
jgi:molecular chaperone GrpE